MMTNQPARLVTPEEVSAFRAQLDPYLKALAANVTEAAPANVREAWAVFVLGWARYCADPPSWSRAPVQIADGQRFASLVNPWRKLLSPYVEANPKGAQLVRWWTWTDELKNFKNKLDGDVRALDQAVAACRSLTDAERADWRGLANAWREFTNKPIGTWDNTDDIEHGFDLEHKIIAWQELIAQRTGSSVGPRIQPSETSPDALRVKRQQEIDQHNRDADRPSQWSGTVMMVAGVAGLIALLGFATKYMPTKGQTA